MRLSLIFLLITAAGCNCSKPPTKPSPKQEGEPCGTDDSCATGMCDGMPGDQPVCVRPCASICKTDEVCVQFTPNRFACQPDPRKLCAPCLLDSDCPYPSDKCLVVNGEKVCGRDCAFDQNCPTGYHCVNGLGTDGQPKPQQCTPINASCACLARGDFNQPCQVTNQFGTCSGTKQCDLIQNTVVCDAATPAAETCNGKDDNCNGSVDEGLSGVVTCGVGECQRTVNACLDGGAATCVPGTPVTEICNGKDDDCDGVIDNGFQAHPHMSACGNVCDVGWVDLNHDVTDGCEYQCTFTSATDLPDLNFVDANCDGIDGEIGNGVFVAPAPLGNDSNVGTMAAPKATLAAAVSWAVTTNKRDVYLAQGVYDGPVTLTGATNLNVAGAYSATTWQRAFTNTVAVDGGNPAVTIDGSNNVLVQALSIAGADGTAALPSAYGIFVRESQGVKLESLDVRAGNGAPGADGAVGTAGTPGSPGGPGDMGCSDSNFFDNIICFLLASCSNGRPSGGTAGTGSCGYSGGIGGQPAFNVDGGAALAGQTAPNGTGSGGAPVPGGLAQGPVAAPYAGGIGAVGLDGSNGTGAAAVGSFGMNGFVPASGAAGTAGQTGKAGGGGGGGGGGLASFPYCPAWGSGGGGGGGGGCGGLPGGGGSGGGASLGLFLYNSTVSGQSVVIRSGNGGRGGNGAAGGAGGLGGAGGVSQYSGGDQGTASIGGAGGKGGNGGRGGHGGAGAGGSAYALAKNAASTWTPVSGTQLTYGSAGAAGTSPGNGSVAGNAGVTLSY